MELKIPSLLLRCALAALLLAVLSAPALGATWTVGPSGANFTSIQAAIDHAAPGDTVLVGAGTYAEAIAIEKSLDLIGSGTPAIDATGLPIAIQVNASAVRLDGFAVAGALSNALILEGAGITVSNCSFEYGGGTDAGVAVGGSSVEDVLFEHNTVTCTGAPGLLMTDAKDLTIRDNRLRTPEKVAILLRFEEARDYSGIAIVHNAIDAPKGYGIEVANTNTTAIRVLAPSIVGNRIVHANNGIGVEGVEGAVIEQNQVEAGGITGNGGFGIRVAGAHGSVLRENVVRNSDLQVGIVLERVDYESESPDEIEMVENRVTNTTGLGMGLDEITGSVLRGNVMEQNRYSFNYYPPYTDAAPSMTIDETNLVDGRPILYYEGKAGVHLDAADRPGMVFFFDCRDVSVADAEFRNTSTGITLYRTEGAAIRNCTFSNLLSGIDAAGSNGGTITGCRWIDTYIGMELYEIAGMTIDHNVFDADRGGPGVAPATPGPRWGVYGIELVAPGPGMRIADNTVSGCLIAITAIEVEPADRLVVANNTLRQGLYGLGVMETANISVTGNRMSGYRGAGLVLSSSAATTITGNRIEANGIGLLVTPAEMTESGNVIADNYFNNTVQVSSQIPPQADSDSPDQVLSPFVTSGKEAGTPLPSFAEKRLTRTIRESADKEAVAAPTIPGPNVWNLSKSAGPNIVGGPYIGGNYWASPNGTGWSETHADRGDGFVAEPYVFDANNTDYLPLHLVPQPYTPHVVPCRIEAEDYDVNGYSDRTPGNAGGAYRNDDVDIEKGGSNFDVGWVKSSEWLEYTVQVDKSGLYVATFRTATPWDGRTILVSVDGMATGVVTVPKTGSFAKYTTVTSTLPLKAGTHHLRLRFVSDGQNLDYLDIAPVKEANFAASPTSGPRSLRVSFTDQSTGTPVKWQWSFGDGRYSTSTVSNPTWYYNRPGTYSVTLKVTYADGTTRTVTRPNMITVR